MNQEILSAGQPTRVGIRDRVLALRSQPMFAGLDDDGLLLLAEHGRSASYADGEVIAVEDEAPRAVYLVVEGEAVVSRHGRHITTRKAGDAYGALPLLAREGSTLAVARGETRTLEFPAAASFHRNLAEEPRNATLLQDALYEVTGRRLGLAFATGEDDEERPAADEAPLDEEGVLELMKETFDAREVEE